MSDQLFVTTRKGLFELRRTTNGKWPVVGTHFLGVPVTNFMRDPRDGLQYVSLNRGHFGVKLHRSEDGQTWEEVATPSYAGIDDKKSLDELWVLEPGDGDTIWAGTVPGGLFKSDDQGATWTIAEQLWNAPGKEAWFGGGFDEPGIHTILAHPENPRKIIVGLSVGGSWKSSDNGETWEAIGKGQWAEYVPPSNKYDLETQDPHRIARCTAHPDVLWVQHHNGMFRSTDNGSEWTELHPPVSNFGFACVAHPSDPDTAWYAPAVDDEIRYPVDGKVVVLRTRDGGETFDELRTGLPQIHAYDLIYRHAFEIDASGEVLAMGSTTGNLWISEDQGDTWELINAHLPPIYAVRFG